MKGTVTAKLEESQVFVEGKKEEALAKGGTLGTLEYYLWEIVAACITIAMSALGIKKVKAGRKNKKDKNKFIRAMQEN